MRLPKPMMALLLLCSTLPLTACGSWTRKPEPQIVYKTSPAPKLSPDLIDCGGFKPPPRNAALQSEWARWAEQTYPKALECELDAARLRAASKQPTEK